MTHETDDGTIDAVWNCLVSNNSGYAVFENLLFSTVTITPIVSEINNWNFDTGTLSGWTLQANGAVISTDHVIGAYSVCITGNGIDGVRGLYKQSLQPLALPAGYYTLGCYMKVVGRTSGVVNVGVLNDTSWTGYAGIGTTANQGWTYYTQRFYMNDHGSGDCIRFYVDGTPNSGASFYIDAITLTPDMAGIAATETRDNTHLYQTFTYTPAGVYSASEYMTKFQSIDITQYAINGCSVTVDGVTKTSYVTGNQIYFDASGLSVNPHSVIITLTYPAQKPIVSFTPDCTVGYSPLMILFEDSSPVRVF